MDTIRVLYTVPLSIDNARSSGVNKTVSHEFIVQNLWFDVQGGHVMFGTSVDRSGDIKR